MRRTDGQSQWNSGREPGLFWKASVVPWFHGFCQPPSRTPTRIGAVFGPFLDASFFLPSPSVRMTRGQTMDAGFPASSRLPPPWNRTGQFGMWEIRISRTMSLHCQQWNGFPGLPACRDEVTEGAAVNARRPRHLDKTPCGLCGLSAGEEPFFFLSVRLPWPNIPPPDAMPGAMARMRDEHITTPRDPNHLGQASLDSGPG